MKGLSHEEVVSRRGGLMKGWSHEVSRKGSLMKGWSHEGVVS